MHKHGSPGPVARLASAGPPCCRGAMEDDLLEESWLFDDGALDSVGGLGGADGLSDDRLLALLPPLPSDGLYEGLEGVGPCAAPAAGGPRRGGEGGARAVGDDTSRAALLRELDDGGGWRCLNRGHPEDCSRCVARRRSTRVEQRLRSRQGFDVPRARCLPAPGPAAAADWVLVGDKSVKSGAWLREQRPYTRVARTIPRAAWGALPCARRYPRGPRVAARAHAPPAAPARSHQVRRSCGACCRERPSGAASPSGPRRPPRLRRRVTA